MQLIIYMMKLKKIQAILKSDRNQNLIISKFEIILLTRIGKNYNKFDWI